MLFVLECVERCVGVGVCWLCWNVSRGACIVFALKCVERCVGVVCVAMCQKVRWCWSVLRWCWSVLFVLECVER